MSVRTYEYEGHHVDGEVFARVAADEIIPALQTEIERWHTAALEFEAAYVAVVEQLEAERAKGWPQ